MASVGWALAALSSPLQWPNSRAAGGESEGSNDKKGVKFFFMSFLCVESLPLGGGASKNGAPSHEMLCNRLLPSLPSALERGYGVSMFLRAAMRIAS